MIEAGTPPRLYVDTTILLDAFESTSVHAERLRTIFKGFETRPGLAVTSEFTLAEVLGKEASRGWAWQYRFYPGLLAARGLFDLRPLTRELLIETGAFRKAARDGARSVKLGDAIYAVTAVDACCRYVFTSDKRFPVPHPLSRLTLDERDFATINHLLHA